MTLQNLLMLEDIQNELNENTCGKDYKSMVCNKLNKRICYTQAIYMETTELIDSYDWKWWKMTEKDIQNAKVELVDIFHFALSLSIIYLNEEEKEIIVNNINLFKDIPENKSDGDFIIWAEKLIKASINIKHALLQNDPELTMDTAYIFIEQTFTYLFLMVNYLMNEEEMIKLYLSKNVLNLFRQDHGYASKTGNYRKIWNGKEDNEVMVEIMDNGKDYDDIGELKEYLYHALEKAYELVD